MKRILQAFCLFVAAVAAVPFAAAISDSSFQACGYSLASQGNCTDARTIIGLMGTIIIGAIGFCVWIGRRKLP